jgi:cytochrome c biogenesis protein CcmG, thiol:disulfide interchange protein DsbE
MIEKVSEDQSTVVTTTRAKGRSLAWWVPPLAFALLIGFLALIAVALKRSQEGPIAIGQPVKPFVLNAFSGEIINTAELSGKVIVVNFWASWCKPCESEAAEMQQAWEFYKPGGQVVFLGVDYVDTEPEARGYLDKFKVTYPNGPDLRTAISQAFRIRGVPETYIIDRSGKLAYKEIGPFQSLSEIISIIDPFLK